jgi:serine/threonine-protein kinase
MLDRYELLLPLADGGMGTVWLARLEGKHGFERLVAIKSILPSFAWDPRFRQMFTDEARIHSGVVHPNVAQILDVGEHRGVLYFVMEWVDGESLRSLVRNLDLKEARLPLPLAVRIGVDLCDGLDAAHEARSADGKSLGIVHRDVSPQNVLIARNGSVKIIDFGVAKSRDRAASETAQGEVKGKARYMAPEQALGCRVDRRADVWAVGAILYELCTGRSLSRARNPVEAVKEMLDGYPREPIGPEVPRPLADVIDKALAADLGERFETCGDLSRALLAVGNECGLVATAAELGAFVETHLSFSFTARRRSIDAALAARAARAEGQGDRPSSNPDGARDSSSDKPSNMPWAVSLRPMRASLSDAPTQVRTPPTPRPAVPRTAPPPRSPASMTPTRALGAAGAPLPRTDARTQGRSPHATLLELQALRSGARWKVAVALGAVFAAAFAVLLFATTEPARTRGSSRSSATRAMTFERDMPAPATPADDSDRPSTSLDADAGAEQH